MEPLGGRLIENTHHLLRHVRSGKGRELLLRHLRTLKLTLVIGQYAQSYHLPGAGKSVTNIVQSWRDHWPDIVPLPHPSFRNNLWLRRNLWFEAELLPQLRVRVAEVLEGED